MLTLCNSLKILPKLLENAVIKDEKSYIEFKKKILIKFYSLFYFKLSNSNLSIVRSLIIFFAVLRVVKAIRFRIDLIRTQKIKAYIFSF